MPKADGGAGGGGGEKAGVCVRCGIEGRVMQCSKCHGVKYCGPECQREDWEQHKRVCKQMASEYAREKCTAGVARFAESRGAAGPMAKAVKDLRRAVQVLRAAKDEAELAESLTALGSALCQQKEYEEALLLLKEALGIVRRLHAGDDERVASAYSAVGRAHFQMGRHGKALKALQKAKRLLMPHIADGEHACRILADTLAFIARAHREEGALPLAVSAFVECIRVTRDARRSFTDQLLDTLFSELGHVYLEMGAFPLAHGAFEEAVEARIRYQGEDTLEVADGRVLIAKGIACLGQASKQAGQVEKAKGLYKAAAKVYLRLLGAEDSKTREALQLARGR